MESIANYELNITEFKNRKISDVNQPSNLDELKEAILQASHKKHSIYPISTGHNWGLGSKLPIENATLISLEKLDRIIEVNEELCYARIQPGVTQGMLAAYLEKYHQSLILNVTGSDAQSSILGNILERGSGKNGHRASDIRELTIMLANGEEISTGFGNVNKKTSCFYQYGLGPSLLHLFTQSNYGIITEGVINLLPKQPFTVYLTNISNDQLAGFVQSFGELVRKQVIGHSLELNGNNDPKVHELFDSSENNFHSWNAWFVIYGEKEIREAKGKALKKEISPYTEDIKSYEYDLPNADLPEIIKVRLRRYNGIPDDHSLIATARSFGVDLQKDGIDIDFHKNLPGFRCVLPVIPFTASGVKEIEFIRSYSRFMECDPVISIINLDDYSLEVFVRVYFNRQNSEEINKASEWATGLLGELKRRNIFPYRLDIENMEAYLNSLEDRAMFWKSQIKEVFDPDRIISARRYCI